MFKEQTINVTQSGGPWLFLAFLALLAGKFTVAPALPWWLVFLPIYLVPAVILAILFVVLIGAGFWYVGKFLLNQCKRGCN